LGKATKSILVIVMITILASMGLTSNQAFGGNSVTVLGPLSASQFGTPQTPIVIPVLQAPCSVPTVFLSEGCAEFSVQISYSPFAGPMVKHFDFTSLGTFGQDDVIHVGEELVVLPFGVNPTGEWSDWHEQIITDGWEWQLSPSIVPSNPGVIVTDMSDPGNPQELWFDFNPPILSTDTSPQLVIQKYLVCKLSICSDPIIEVHQFPTLDIDFGDLSDGSFPTFLFSDGARHFPDVLVLGTDIDTEPDGQQSLLADGDDKTNTGSPDDEDNITFTSLITPGATASVDITVTGGTGVIDAWIDFNLDRDFDLPSEKLVFSPNAAVSPGTNSKTFLVPAGATLGVADSRWRVSTTGAPLPTGYEPDGEVEDHRFAINSVGAPGPMFADNFVHASWTIPPGSVPRTPPDSFETFSSSGLQLSSGVFMSCETVRFTEFCTFHLPNFIDDLDTKIVEIHMTFTGEPPKFLPSMICFQFPQPTFPVFPAGFPGPGSNQFTWRTECHPNPDAESIRINREALTTMTLVEIWTTSFDDIPIDIPIGTSLLLAGTQMTASWLIPVIVAGAGIVLVLVRKSENH